MPEIEDINIVYNFLVRGAANAEREITKLMAATELSGRTAGQTFSQYKKQKESMVELSQAFVGAQAKFFDYNHILSEGLEYTDAYNNAIKKGKSHLEALEIARRSTIAGLTRSTNAMEKNLQTMIALGKETFRTKMSQGDYEIELEKIEALEKAGLPIKEATILKKRLLIKAIKDGAVTQQQAKKAMAEYNETLQELNKNTGNSIFKAAQWALTWFVLYRAIRFVVGGITESFKLAVEFDKALTALRAVSGASSESIEQLGNSAINLSKKFGISFIEITNSMVEWARQGLQANQIAEMMNTTLLLSNVAGIGMADAIKYLTSVIYSYDINANKAIDIVDKWVKLDMQHAVTTEQLATGFTIVAAAAKEYGVSIDSLNAMLTTMAEVTQRSGSEIARALKMIFTRLYEPSTIKDLYHLTGVMAMTTKGLKPIEQTLGEIAVNWNKYSEAQKRSIAVAIAGERQSSLAIALLSNWNKYLKAKIESETAHGEAMERNKVIMESYSKQFAVTTAKIKAFLSDVGKLLTPLALGIYQPIGDILESISGGIKSLLNYTNNLKEAGNVTSNVSNVIKDGSYTISKYSDTITDLSDRLSNITGNIDKFNSSVNSNKNQLDNLNKITRDTKEQVDSLGQAIENNNQAMDLKAWVDLEDIIKSIELRLGIYKSKWDSASLSIEKNYLVAVKNRLGLTSLDKEYKIYTQEQEKIKEQMELLNEQEKKYTEFLDETRGKLKEVEPEVEGLIQKYSKDEQIGQKRVKIIKELSNEIDQYIAISLVLGEILEENVGSAKKMEEVEKEMAQSTSNNIKKVLEYQRKLEEIRKTKAELEDKSIDLEEQFEKTFDIMLTDAFEKGLEEIGKRLLSLDSLAETLKVTLEDLTESFGKDLKKQIAEYYAKMLSELVYKKIYMTMSVSIEDLKYEDIWGFDLSELGKVGLWALKGIYFYTAMVPIAIKEGVKSINDTYQREGHLIGTFLGSLFGGAKWGIIGGILGGVLGALVKVEGEEKKSLNNLEEMNKNIDLSVRELQYVNRNLIALRQEIKPYPLREEYYFRPYMYLRDQDWQGREKNIGGTQVSVGNLVVNIENAIDPKAVVRTIEEAFTIKRASLYQGV